MNQYDPNKHHRRSIRLKGWDYRTAGYYFVTICTYQRENTFGHIQDGVIRLSELGEIVREEWLKTAVLRENVSCDEFTIMPNHLHGILELHDPTTVGAGGPPAQKCDPRPTTGRPAGTPLQNGSLGLIIGQFKTAVTKRFNSIHKTTGLNVWQRGYYERIVRNERELNAIRQYIQNNPTRWAEDRDNLDVLLTRMNGCS